MHCQNFKKKNIVCEFSQFYFLTFTILLSTVLTCRVCFALIKYIFHSLHFIFINTNTYFKYIILVDFAFV